jgi:5-(carboxyamino)imidazole ribonucleotide mutase
VSEIDVALLMGSSSDWKHLESAVTLMEQMGLRLRVHVTSAHRTPERTIEIVQRAEDDGCAVFICAAGMAAHLAGAVAAHSLRPVLGVPLPGGMLDGLDALLSTVQMPAGIPVATFGVGSAGAKNAAYFAAQIVSAQRQEVAEAVAEARRQGADKISLAEGEVIASLEARRG